jgi:hypothetical protein
MALVTSRGRTYEPTDRDRLWLSRAVEAEGEPRELVAQALVNRWAWAHDLSPAKWPDPVSMIRAYSQPVNPEWYPDGKKHQAKLAKLTGDKRAAELAAAPRRRDVHSTATEFRPETVAAVRRAFDGPISLPRGVVHFAAPNDYRRRAFEVLVPGVRGKTNELYAERHPHNSRRARYAVTRAAQEWDPAARKRASKPKHPHARLLEARDAGGGFALLLLLGLPWVLKGVRWGRK